MVGGLKKVRPLPLVVTDAFVLSVKENYRAFRCVCSSGVVLIHREDHLLLHPGAMRRGKRDNRVVTSDQENHKSVALEHDQ